MKPNTSIQGGSLDDSLKRGTERTSLLGDPKVRKKSEALDEDGEIEDDGKMTKMQIYFRREEIADKALVSAVKTLA